MDPIRTLQSRAAEKRDLAIAEARRQYRKDIEAIEALSNRLPTPPNLEAVKSLSKAPALSDHVVSVIPADRSFTVSDVLNWLHTEYGGTHHRPSVRTYVSQLCSKGFLRRLYKTHHKETCYIRADSAAMPEQPIETKQLIEVAADILREAGRPLKVSEIAVSMRERGYRVDNAPNTLMRAIRDSFARYRGQFERGKDGRWGVST